MDFNSGAAKITKKCQDRKRFSDYQMSRQKDNKIQESRTRNQDKKDFQTIRFSDRPLSIILKFDRVFGT